MDRVAEGWRRWHACFGARGSAMRPEADGEQFHVTWIDGHREPQCAPNPAYPDGVVIHAPEGVRACAVNLPYPAKRCGFYRVHCTMCGTVVLITTAGRPDDPRQVEIPCLLKGEA